MKFYLILVSLFLISTQAMAGNYSCRFTDTDNNRGSVSITVNGDTLKAKLNRRTYLAQDCLVDRTLDSEVLVTCDENSGNGMGFMAQESNGKIEGYLIIEELSFFGELSCR